jgi:hypothetical protein
MSQQFKQIEYFKASISVWSHSRNASEPWNVSLEDFLCGKVFKDRNFRFILRDLSWFFKGTKRDANPAIDPKHYRTIERIIDKRSLPDAVEQLRNYIALNGKDEVVHGVKKLMPGATISAQFQRRRGIKQEHKKSFIVAIDIDDVDAHLVMQQLNELSICFWISQSISGTGVYGLVPVATENLQGHFEAINLLLLEKGITLDPLKDVTRLRYWSPPDDGIINCDVKPFQETYNLPGEIKEKRYFQGFEPSNFQVTTEFDSPIYANACHKRGLRNASQNLNKSEGDIGEHLNSFIKYYHWAYNHYGISLDYAIEWSWENFFKDHDYIKLKQHEKEKLAAEFRRFYSSYRGQHHSLDFNQPKKNFLSTETYDMEFTLNRGEKLSTIVDLPGVGNNSKLDEEEWDRYILDSPTNSGKTTTFAKFFLRTKIKGLIVVPTQGALEQLKKDHKDIKLFYQYDKDVSESDTVIATTYTSFTKLFGKVDMYSRFLVVDEFHNVVLSSSKDFRNYELNLIMDCLIFPKGCSNDWNVPSVQSPST